MVEPSNDSLTCLSDLEMMERLFVGLGGRGGALVLLQGFLAAVLAEPLDNSRCRRNTYNNKKP